MAVDRLRPGNQAVLTMTGTWRFKLDHGASPAVKGELPADAAVPDFAAPDFPDGAGSGWTNIPVPANWEVEGFSMLTYQDRTANPSDDIGLYRRLVDVPASFAGQRVLWHFDGVFDGAEVFVNGQRVGYHESGFTAFDMDVTKALKPGQRNLMALRVYKKTSTSNLEHRQLLVPRRHLPRDLPCRPSATACRGCHRRYRPGCPYKDATLDPPSASPARPERISF